MVQLASVLASDVLLTFLILGGLWRSQTELGETKSLVNKFLRSVLCS